MPIQEGVPFLVTDHGRVNGEPYVLPHDPGEQAFGLVPGWYVWTMPIEPGAAPEGPFNFEYQALACVEE